ncbi:hypothetical protein BDN72DRAFT_940331, partial [Pluteus cervinus]
HQLFTSQVFSHLVLDFTGHPPKVHSSIRHLRDIASGTAFACRYARTLEIWSLENLHPHTQYTASCGPENFGNVLENALRNLKCLESLRYLLPTGRCCDGIRMIDIDPSSHFSWLADTGDITKIEAGVLRGVRSLVSSHRGFTATVAADWEHTRVVQQLREICPTSFLRVLPYLKMVSYGNLDYSCGKETGMLALEIFTGSLNVPSTILEDATYWLPAANFKRIRTLQIRQIQTDVSQTIFYRSAFWMALGDAGCQPLEFSADFITDTMLGYLTSFSNLQYLCLQDTRNNEGVHSSEKLATKFYKEVLRAHRESLQTLVIDVKLPGPWFMQHSNIEDLFVCQKLKKLAIALSYQRYPRDTASEDLLQRALNLRKSLPDLWQLSILQPKVPGFNEWLDSPFDSSIEAFRGKGPPIMAVGTRHLHFTGRYAKVDGLGKVLLYRQAAYEY